MLRTFLSVCTLLVTVATALATSTHHYGKNEYVTIASGLSPDGKYAITAHGEGELGDENFHLYLTDAATGKNIRPLAEVVDVLDTGAGASCAKWTPNSQTVTIVYRVDRHALKAVTYHLADGHARCVKPPHDVVGQELTTYWQQQSSEPKPSPKVFGMPAKP